MAQTPPAKAPTGPKVSGTRTVVSLVFLVVVLVVCGIELRAGLGQFLTLRAFNDVNVSENSLFKNKSFDEAHGMVAAFPSKSEVQTGVHEDVHHFYWYSLLRPLMGEKNPEVFVSADHGTPPNAVSFYTSTEGEVEKMPVDPNAVPADSQMSSGGPMPKGMGMGMGMGMGGRPGGGPPAGGPPAGGGIRPPMENDTTDPAAPDAPKTEGETGAAPTDAAPTDAAPTDAAPNEPEPTTDPAKEDDKSESPATPN